MARLEGWQEITLLGPTLDRLLVVDGPQTLGVPMFRPRPWKGLNLTAKRMLARMVQGSGSLDHFQSSSFDIVRVHFPGRMYGFRDMAGASALSQLARPSRQFVKRRGELYFLADEGRRVGQALLTAYGTVWLDEPNPDCREGWIS